MAETLPSSTGWKRTGTRGSLTQPVMPCEETPRPGILGMTMRKHVITNRTVVMPARLR